MRRQLDDVHSRRRVEPGDGVKRQPAARGHDVRVPAGLIAGCDSFWRGGSIERRAIEIALRGVRGEALK